MIPIVCVLSVVERYAPAFEEVFTPSESKQFSRYLCGLLTSDNKTVESINRLFIDDMMDQSTLNRFLSHSRFDVRALNDARLSFLQSDNDTAFRQGNNQDYGVLVLDDTLLQHYGPKKEGAAWLRDPHGRGYRWSHNLVNLHYSDDRTDYPVDFRLWESADLSKIEVSLRAAGFDVSRQAPEHKQKDDKGWRRYLLSKYNKARCVPPKGKPPVKVVHLTKLDLAKQIWSQKSRSCQRTIKISVLGTCKQ
jgi:DDE superfamily endonuclease